MLKAVIFDLDGTIIINNEAYDVAFSTVLKELGATVGKEFNHTGGIGVKSNWKNLIAKYNLDENLSLDDLEQRTQKAYLRNFDKIKIRDGFAELINDIRKNDMKIALATGNDEETTRRVLEHFEIEEIFEVTVTIYEAGKPKPEPDIFLLAAKRLKLDPKECLVIEDSEAGFESAEKANMPVVSVHETSFEDLTAEKLRSYVVN